MTPPGYAESRAAYVAGCLVCGGDCSPWPYSLFAFDRKQIEPFCSRVCLNEFAAQYDGSSDA